MKLIRELSIFISYALLLPGFCRAFLGQDKMKQPLVRPLNDGKTWSLEENFVYILSDERVVFIPASFQFDFASIPRVFWRLFPPATGKHRVGALVHDWLCASGNTCWSDAAEVFLEVMIDSNVGIFKRNIIYCAVLSFGMFHKQDKRQDALRKMQDDAVKKSGINLTHYIL